MVDNNRQEIFIMMRYPVGMGALGENELVRQLVTSYSEGGPQTFAMSPLDICL